MSSTEGFPYHVSTNNVGANTSDEKEIVGSKEGSGEFVHARNARPVSVDGNTGSLEKIKGESLFYQESVSGAYQCIGAHKVNGDIVEVWASTNVLEPTFVRVNGVVVLKSILFDYHPSNPLQMDANEDEEGGEVFMTDDVIPPMIFNVQDMVDSLISDPTKYFSAFDPLLYSINLYVPLDIPAFIETVNVGGGGGLPVGTYSYQLRYSNGEGDRTNLSQRTPQIPIVENLSVISDQYPGAKTYGRSPDPDFGTRYGIKLRFRITNLQGYDFVEIIRTSYNTNGGIDFVPAPKIIAKIDIFANEISVREFTDPVESNTSIVLSNEDITKEITFINAAKTIRYFDRRAILMNVLLASKESTLTFNDINGKVMFPVIDKLGTIGFNDSYNFTYKRSIMHGERFGYGVNLYDGVGGRGFTTKIPGFTNYQMPNRRDTTSAETDLYSYLGVVKTTNVFNAITNTHEVFDHVNAISKTDKCSFKNIYHNRIASFIVGTKLKETVKDRCDETDGEIESHGAKIYTLINVSPYYHPFTPTRANDSAVDGHNYIVNTQVCKTNANVLPAGTNPAADKREDYSPKIFGPEYYSQGMALAGIDNFPSWAKSFSIVKTARAGRVIAQGIGMYKLNPADYDLATVKKLLTKDSDVFWFYSPDLENGIVSGRQIDDIISAPEGYAVQFVSPLGFASEIYSFDANNILQDRDKAVDMIVYARMQRDKTDDWEINPMEFSDMGFDGGDGYRYVGYGRWRNTGQTPTLFATPQGGNTVFAIRELKRLADGRGTYMSIRLDGPSLYGRQNVGGVTDSDFESDGLKNWTEPFYMVNIISDGAIVRNQNIENYTVAAHYQKLESIIGRGNGASNQKYLLVDERWEDVIPALDSTWPTATTDRYIYIKKVDNTVEKWINVTFKTAVQIATIANDINVNGFYGPNVTGMYRHEDIDSQHRFFNIVFNAGFFPAVGDLILIRYDNTAPIRFFGGDSVIGESIFAPIDRETAANGESSVSTDDSAPDTHMPFGLGFPYKLWQINPRYYQIRRTRVGSLGNVIQDRDWGYLGFMRQMCVMFTAESRIALPYALNSDLNAQFFPLSHYVIRPHRWDPEYSYYDNNIYPNYEQDYPGEKELWKWGGFRFNYQINADYSTLPPKEFVSKPEFGFEEKLRFNTRIMWSLPRQINKVKSPGLKTFPANNSFDIDDNMGEIKYAYDSTTDKGSNLYSITNTGICLLVTKKSILSDLDAGELAYMSASGFVKQQYWITKDIGMFDEFWRTAAEAYVPVTLQDGSEVRIEALFFANNESVFRFMENDVKDIGRIKFHNTLYKKVLSRVLPGYSTHIAASFDKYHQEYFLHIDTAYKTDPTPTDIARTYIFGQANGRWYGYYDYKFDKAIAMSNKMYSMRDGETFELGVGYAINNANIIFELDQVASPTQFADKEFIRVRINTGDEVKPTDVEFYDKYEGNLMCLLNFVTKGNLYLKKYRGWEQFVPRADLSFNASRNRVQGRILTYKIIHNLPEDFRIIDTGIQYKEIVM